jgi:hypothetical protein
MLVSILPGFNTLVSIQTFVEASTSNALDLTAKDSNKQVLCHRTLTRDTVAFYVEVCTGHFNKENL